MPAVELRWSVRSRVGFRKTVTVVFSDLVGSTVLDERLDPESRSREEVPWAVRRLFEALARGRPLIVVVFDRLRCGNVWLTPNQQRSKMQAMSRPAAEVVAFRRYGPR